MSRGLGIVQRGVQAALEAEPTRRFTVAELAGEAYPGEVVGRAQLVAVRRALGRLTIERCRVGASGRRGWRYRVSLEE
jgi:hypothetical protein